MADSVSTANPQILSQNLIKKEFAAIFNSNKNNESFLIMYFNPVLIIKKKGNGSRKFPNNSKKQLHNLFIL